MNTSLGEKKHKEKVNNEEFCSISHSFKVWLLDKVVNGGTNTPDQCYCLFLKSAKYVALTLEMAVILNINTTLKEFRHTLCKAHALHLKGKARVKGSC